MVGEWACCIAASHDTHIGSRSCSNEMEMMSHKLLTKESDDSAED